MKNRQKSYEYQAKWRRKNREKLNKRNAEHARIYSKILREGVIKEYGKKCRCCGVIEIEFLTIDHINGGGNKHRKEIGESNMYKWLKKQGFPKEGFQILCMNCNWATRNKGICPHKSN